MSLYINAFPETTKVLADAWHLFQNETELEAEQKVVPQKSLKIKETTGRANEINKHYRDSQIKFFPEQHIYLIDDNPKTISAGTLVKRFFTDYDREAAARYVANRDQISVAEVLRNFEDNRKNTAKLGKQLHLDIENYFRTNKKIKPQNKPEFDYFLDFYETRLGDSGLYRTEWHIFDDLIYVAGTVDMVFKKADDTYAIYDWNRSKEILTSNPYKNGIGVCDDMPDCNYYHYSLRLNIYKKILEEYYAKSVSEMHIVQLHPRMDTYRIYKVPDLQVTVNKMFDELLS